MTDGVATGEWRLYGPSLLGAALALGCGYSLFLLTSSLISVPLEQEFGWSRAQATLAPLAGLVAALASPFAGQLAGRFGTAPSVLTGTGIAVIGLLTLALSSGSYWLAVASVSLIAIGGTLSGIIVLSGFVVRRFETNRALAIGILTSGTGAVGAVSVPAAAAYLESFGWRSMLVALAVIVGAAGSVFAYHARHDARPASTHRAATSQSFIDDPRLWLLAGALLTASLAIGGYIAHLASLLRAAGAASDRVGVIASVFILSMSAGRLLAGYLLDRLPPVYVTGSFFALAAVGAGSQPWLAASDPALFFALAGVGLAQGAEADVAAVYVARLFGEQNYERLFGVMCMIAALGIAAGGFLFSILYDLSGTYRHAHLWASGLLLIATFLITRIALKPVLRQS